MHSWFKYCIGKDDFEKVDDLKSFMKVLKKQSNVNEARIPYREVARLDDYDEDSEFIGKLAAPRYFGAGFEALSESFLETFGQQFNLTDVKSLDDVAFEQEDTGYDLTAKSIKSKIYKGIVTKKTNEGSGVYIQVKATFNPVKEFYTNDGSRIMNFYGNAQGHARANGQAYQARFLLVTSGKDLHYKLDNNTFKEIEVINFNRIQKMTKDNTEFWNNFRQKLGLSKLQYNPRPDPEAESIQKEIELYNA